MSVITTVISKPVDLDHGVQLIQPLKQRLVYGNNQAHSFRLECFRGDAPADLTGAACSGFVRRADEVTIPVEGFIDGNTAGVTLTAPCYAVPGLVTISMELTIGSVRATHAIWFGMVECPTTDMIGGEAAVSAGECMERTEAAAERAESAAERAEATDAGQVSLRLDELSGVSMTIKGIMDQTADYNDLVENGIYYLYVPNEHLNSPDGGAGILTVTEQSGVITQDYVNIIDGSRFVRYRQHDEWKPWKGLPDPGETMQNKGSMAPDEDFDNLITNGIYYGYIPNTHLNSPDGGVGVLTVTEHLSVIAQDWVNIKTGARFARYSQNGTWADWQSVPLPDTVMLNRKALAADADFDAITTDGVYYAYVPNTHINRPESGAGILTVTTQKSVTTQDWVNIQTGMRYARYSIDGTWRSWAAPAYRPDRQDGTAVYYAFGDSTTYGQIAVTGGQSKYNYPSCVGRALGMQVVNKGVGGQGLLKDWDFIHENYINALDMSDAKLVTIGWAYNDYSLYAGCPMGTSSDTTEDTVIGRYYTIMKEFQEKCPQAMIVLITGYGCSGSYPQFTEGYQFADKVYRVKTFYDTLEEMCHLNGWCCVNQAKGSWVTKLNWDRWIGDSIHPTNEGYLRYGNYMAGKLSALYSNLSAW